MARIRADEETENSMTPRDVRAARGVGVGEHVIEVRGLVKRYPDITAVDGIDFDVNRGEVFSLLGPNGAGKTTTVEILEGLRDPTAGEARVLGEDVRSGYRRIRERVGVLPQDFEPFDRLRPREAVAYWAHLFDHAVSEGDVANIIETVGLLNHGKIVAHGSPSALISQFGEGTTVVLAGAGRGGFEALVSRGIAAELHGVDVLVHVPMASQVRPMLAKLASIEVPLTEIYTKRSTLEDVFLKLVGARMEEGVLAA